MIPRLHCTIEVIGEPATQAWIVSVSHADVPAMILLLNGLIFHKIPQISFADKKTGKNVSLSAVQKEDYVLHLMGRSVSVTKAWLEALLSTMLDVQFCGWDEGAHLDAEFTDPYGTLDLTVCIRYL